MGSDTEQTQNGTKEKKSHRFLWFTTWNVALGRGRTWVCEQILSVQRKGMTENASRAATREGVICASPTEQDTLNYAGLLILLKLFGIGFVPACIHFWRVAGKGHSCTVKNQGASERSLPPEFNEMTQSVHLLVTCHSNDNEAYVLSFFFSFSPW